MKVELFPDLTHCIETVARERHSLLSKQLLGAEHPEPEVERELEILRLFLEKADFRGLRAESEAHMTAGKKVRFTVYLEKGVPDCRMHTWA